MNNHLFEKINILIRKYPSSFKGPNYNISKLRVLNYLYFTIGTGFDWFDGHICGEGSKVHYGEDSVHPGIIENDFFKNRGRSLESLSLGTLIDLVKFGEKDQKLADKLYNIDYSDYSNRASLYPICEYSLIITMPENVRSDYLAGAILIYEYARNFYKKNPDKEQEEWLDKVKYNFNYKFGVSINY